MVLDLTPNYLGEAPWFSPAAVDSEVMERVKVRHKLHFMILH